MPIKSYSECDRSLIQRYLKYQFPNSFKRIGMIVAVVSFLMIIVSASILENESAKLVAKAFTLIGLLIVSLSKEKVEDELMIKLRMQSYSISFILAVIYALLTPIMVYVLGSLFGKANMEIEGMGDFLILWMLLTTQVLYFEILKRNA